MKALQDVLSPRCSQGVQRTPFRVALTPASVRATQSLVWSTQNSASVIILSLMVHFPPMMSPNAACPVLEILHKSVEQVTF